MTKAKPVMNRTIMRERNKQQKSASKEYISAKQRKQLLSDVGDSGAILYWHYFESAAYKNFDITNDKRTATALIWPERKVARERLKLLKTDWVFYHTFSSPSMGKFHLTILGKQAITDYRNKHTIDVLTDTSSTIEISDEVVKQFKQHDEACKMLIKKGNT